MIYPENRYLFTMKDICHACNISRATLIRMEESGFLTPYKIDEHTGYRYYDADNIAQIGQYRILQELGLSRNEITDIYYRNFDAQTFIMHQQEKINNLQKALDKFELIYTKNKNHDISYINLPEVTCYCVSTPISAFDAMETHAFEIYQQIVREGFQINGAEPMFVYFQSSNTSSTNTENQTTLATVCIPIVPNQLDSPNIQTFPACRAFSLIEYGDYPTIIGLIHQAMQEVTTRGLKPIGPARIICLVAAYTGAHISNNDFCYQYALPIE